METDMEIDLEVIDAFVDGERVDRDALKRALAGEAGREYLEDVLALRELGGQLPFQPAILPRPIRRVLPARWALAASLVICALGAYAVGHHLGVAAVQPTGASTALERSGEARPPASIAPAPTRIIRLQPGVNWTEYSGGN